ncbi:MAG TPA: penicillin acylase family protein [Pyrinomonadaceae bacterium]|nr:penicillin acylase family protein [Pyrinomonadaceae bacterium]
MKKQLLAHCLLLSLFLTHASTPNTTVYAQTPAASSSTSNSQTLAVAGLRAPVRIRRDERGIPHIEATHESDLYFAQGYATAADRLWQMDLLRRTARGELAEIFGRPALEEDKRRRVYGFAALSEALIPRVSAATRAALEDYARGVNAYIESRGTKETPLPAEFQIIGYRPRPWRTADSLVIAKLFAEMLSTTWPTDISRALLADLPPARRAALLPDSSPLDVLVVGSDNTQPSQSPTNNRRKPATKTPQQKTRAAKVSALRIDTAKNSALSPASFDERERVELLAEVERISSLSKSSLERVGLYMEGRAVSNNWVVSGRRTASGKPLLANDPHLPASAPSIWHMAHLTAPGLNVAGVTAPGAPGIIIGHNERIAWGMTNLDPDVQDLYLERFSADRKNFYETPTGLREAEVRREEIKVRKGLTDASTETVMHEVTVTRHGPIILEREGKRYALRWTALDPTRTEFDAFYKINRARDWNEFRDALSGYSGPTQNFVYADTAGHIGYYGAGLIPVRRSGDGSLPYDGAGEAGEWTTFIPFDELPHSYDPPSGLIVTANSRVVGRSYPHHLTHQWSAPYRARRIYDLLNRKRKLTAADFRSVQADVYSIGGVEFARSAAQLLRGLASRPGITAQTNSDESKLRAAAATSLASWDGRVTADSTVAPLVAEMSTAFRGYILNSALGEARARSFRWASYDLFFNRVVAERPAGWLPKEFASYDELMRACLRDARAALTKRLGADESTWTWGRYSPAQFPHPLAVVPFIGSRFTIEPFPVNGSGYSAGATVNVGAFVSMRLIADLSDWDKTEQGIALGVSGDPSSPHWSDQLADWRAVTPRPLPFNARTVAAHTRETLTLTPK